MTLKRLIDADPEIAEKLVSRRDAIARGASKSSSLAIGLAMGSVPVALAAVASDVFAQGGLPSVVVDALNFALTLEHLEAQFYQTGVATRGLLSRDTLPVFDQIRKHEVAHVAFLQQVLGSRAIRRPSFDYSGGYGKGNGPFADVFSNEKTFAAVAQTFEDTGVRAYKGQATNLMGDDGILEAALRIHSVEARHAAEVRRLRGQKSWISLDTPGALPAVTQPSYNGEANRFHFILARPINSISMTEAFDEPLTKSQVMGIVAPFIAGE